MTMTALVGHLMELDYAKEFQNWQQVPIVQLFDAPIIKQIKQDMQDIADNIKRLAKNSQILVIWTDNDREGENIGAEVASVAQSVNPRIIIKRARFSVVQDREIKQAWNLLLDLDYKQAEAVDARSELDLRIGACFTRFQTLNLRDQFKDLIDAKVISYGSCQFPTLGFIVDRFLRVQEFIPENFWKIELSIQKDGIVVPFHWKRSCLFDQHVVFALYEQCVENPTCTITQVTSKPTSRWPPLPLTTVELQKVGSSILKMSSDRIMTIAEKLYNQGIISYPRTETDSFDDQFQLKPLIEAQTQDSVWGEYAASLLAGKFKKPRKGKHNDQAHPPIHPVRAAFNLQGDEKRLFEFITRRFLACCSEAAKGQSTIVTLRIADEIFSASGLQILEQNYLQVYTYDKWTNSFIPNFERDEHLQPNRLEMTQGKTSPPSLLTEANLIALMDQNGIGTDATIHEHIKKIIEREYTNKEGEYFYPTTLGMALVKGYDEMDMNISLSKPYLRSQMELNMKGICDGIKSKDNVIRESLSMYKDAFLNAQSQLHTLQQSVRKYLGIQDDHRQPSANPNPRQNDVNVMCQCGEPAALRKVSKSGPSCGKEFYTCAKGQNDANKCQFFQWTDATNVPSESLAGNVRRVPTEANRETLEDSNAPQCQCNLICSLRQVKKQGPTLGRYFYVCPKGQDDGTRCDMFQWKDDENQPMRQSNVQCHCGTEAVQKTVRKQGPTLGRAFYACKKGQSDSSRCDFFQWADEEMTQSQVTRQFQNLFEGQDSDAKPRCDCQLVAAIRTCNKAENKGRRFYCCTKKVARCQFFQWADEVNSTSDAMSSSLECYRCHETGHMASQCTQSQRKPRKRTKKSN